MSRDSNTKNNIVKSEEPAIANQVLTRAQKEERRKKRKEGGGLSVAANKLKFTRPEYEREGYVRAWPLDMGDRLNEVLTDDFDYVLDSNGQKIKQFGGFDKFGNPVYHILVEKPKEWHEEDRKERTAAAMAEQERVNKAAIERASAGVNITRNVNIDPQYKKENAALNEID